MAKVKIQGNASGTGILTVTAPNTSTDRTITLPDGTGTLIADDGSGKVGIGTASPNHKLSVSGAGSQGTLGLYSSGTSNELRLEHDGGSHWVMNGVSDGIRFKASNSEKIRIDGDGLKFNGDTAAANALDDYEEGNWTPTWSPTGGSWSGTGVGKYTKIGRQVTASFLWVASGQATGSKFNAVGGLPFTCLNETTTYVASVAMNGGGASGHSLTATLSPNQTSIYLQMQPDSTSAHGEFTPSQTASNCTFNLTITYMTA